MKPTAETPKPKSRRWLRFSIRGVMILTLLVSFPLAWFAKDVVRSQRETATVKAIERAGGSASYDYQQGDHVEFDNSLAKKVLGKNVYAFVTKVNLRQVRQVEPIIPQLRCFHRLEYLALPSLPASDELVATLTQLPMLKECSLDLESGTPEQLRQLAECDGIEELCLRGTAATDDVIAELPRFRNLKSLTLRESPMSDESMRSISRILTLERLELDGAPEVTSAGFACLITLTQLDEFRAWSTRIDDKCLDTLPGMPQLEVLNINPGVLSLAYMRWGAIRLDTKQPIQSLEKLREYKRDESVQVVHVDTYSISFYPRDRLPLPPMSGMAESDP